MKMFASLITIFVLMTAGLAQAGGGGVPHWETVAFTCGHDPAYGEIQIINGAGMDYRLDSTNRVLWEPEYAYTSTGLGTLHAEFVSGWVFDGGFYEGGILTSPDGDTYQCISKKRP